jgi:hypothetical protein
MKNINIKNLDKRILAIFVLFNIILLLFFGNILIRIIFFLFCVIFLYYFGSIPIDADPVPITTFIMLMLFDYKSAIGYLIFVLPVADMIASRFNQYSFVNFTSVLVSLSIMFLLKNILSTYFLIIIFLLLFNIIRQIIYILMGQGFRSIIAPFSHFVIYFVIAYPISLFL